MFNLKKVGKNCINVCTTTPCWLRGSDSILSKFKKKLKISNDEVTKDNFYVLPFVNFKNIDYVQIVENK